MKLLTNNIQRTLFFIVFDSVLSLISFLSAYMLRFNFEISDEVFGSIWFFFAALIALKTVSFALFGVYLIPWRFFSLDGLARLAKAHLLAYSLFAIGYMAAAEWLPVFPRSVLAIDLSLSLILLGALRVAKRFATQNQIKAHPNAIIIGSDDTAEKAYRAISDMNVLFFVDNCRENRGLKIHGKTVIDFAHLKNKIKKHSIETAIITDAAKTPIKTIYDKLNKLGIKRIKVAKTIGEIELNQLNIEDLLARNPKDLDTEAIKRFVVDKTILITGGGGSIGAELSRRSLHYGAKKLVLLDSSEYNLYAICDELNTAAIVPKLTSVTDKAAMEAIFCEHKPQIVLHAAAYKHVPLVEINQKAAIFNNVIGTKTCIDLAIKHGAETFVLISTDKAVRPTSVMGATKRVCELYLQNVPCGSTRLAAVRFGNVLGSSGSVIPRFRRLIDENKPLTVTHPQMTRYFMLISEAVELVLQAASLARGGEVFVLDMGEPIKIVDMAQKMLDLAGKSELGIVFTGLRSGEKLYEELLIDESDRKTKYDSIFVGKPSTIAIEELSRQITALTNSDDPIAALKAIVPEFHHNKGV
jgi:UDP-N-acetyl-D-glucosamine 4,6-dehydratase